MSTSPPFRCRVPCRCLPPASARLLPPVCPAGARPPETLAACDHGDRLAPWSKLFATAFAASSGLGPIAPGVGDRGDTARAVTVHLDRRHQFSLKPILPSQE